VDDDETLLAAFLEEALPKIERMVTRALVDGRKLGELAIDLEKKIGVASSSEVSEWVERLAHDVLEARSNLVTAMELAAGDLIAVASAPPPPMAHPAHASNGNIPIHLDPLAPPHNEVPSSSAVFAHSHPSHDVPVTTEVDPRTKQVAMLVMVASCLLAIIGVVLGTYALTHRTTPAAPAAHPSAAPSPSPNPTFAPTIAPTDAPSSGVDTSPSTAPTASAVTAATASASAAALATAAATATATATGTATAARPAQLAAPPAAPRPKPKCDPPYTIDDVGHRHYKPECMGLE
jgi:serine/threonine-protein kinase